MAVRLLSLIYFLSIDALRLAVYLFAHATRCPCVFLLRLLHSIIRQYSHSTTYSL